MEGIAMENFLIAARAVHYAATIALAGGFAFLCLVAGPAFRRAATDPAAAVYLRRSFAWLGWASLVLALASGAAWLTAVAATMSGEPISAVWSQGVVVTVSTETRFGEVWLLRLALAVLVGLCLLAQERQRDWASGVAAWAALAVAAGFLASLAWAGHGAATPGAPGEFHLAADILHLLAAGAWLGTLPPLALLLAEARRIGGAGWTAIARAATRRFSAMAVASVAVLFAAGLVNTWFLAGTVPAVVGTEYGHWLLAKIAIFLVMVLIAAVNLFRLTPRLAAATGNAVAATLGQLRRNAWVEAGCGLGVLAVVGVLGILPPGLHSEPGWPLPFRIDPAELGRRATIGLMMLALLFTVCLVATVIRAAAGHYRRALLPLSGLVLCLAIAWLPLRQAVEPAYPTTFYAPTEPYAAPPVARGQPLYAQNCALCHGADGRGKGPAAAGLPIRPADLLAPHLFAHPPGDLFWWIGHGRGNGAMPGFAAVLSPAQRWDLVDFIRARAAGALSQDQGPAITAAAAYPVPDFAFERDGRQQTLSALLERGPVLLVLFRPPAPAASLTRLAAARQELAAAGLGVVAVDLGGAKASPGPKEAAPPFAIAVAADAATSLALFMPAPAAGPCALMLDRAGNVRARWTAEGAGGLPDPAVLAAAAARVARFPAAAPSHAGHAG
jgi:copper resistance protein D